MADVVCPRRKPWHSRCGMAAAWGLVGSILCSAGLWILPAQAQMAEARVAAFVEALRQAAPHTGRDNDGLYRPTVCSSHDSSSVLLYQ